MPSAEPLSLRLLGEIELVRGGKPLTLPASKKTRALLAYLAITAKAHRRERLCNLFWDVPDDPRGALRWSLSKLRALVDEPDRPRIAGGRETVSFDAEGVDIDVLTARRRAQNDGGIPLAELKKIADLFRGEFLEGLDLATCPEFEAWRAAEREEARALHRRVLTSLIDRLAPSPAEALPYARVLVGIDPYALSAHETLLRLLAGAGRLREAEEQFAVSSRQLAEASQRSANALGESWRALSRARSDAGAAPAPAPAGVPAPAPERRHAALKRSQTIRFCIASDGVRIAYSTVGHGPPLVKCANWLNHLEFDWESPVWRHWMEELSRDRMLVRYDERGNGLSDWNVDDISFEAFVRDLETVVDAAGLERFALFGISQGVGVSIAYAVRHPERVSRLVLHAGYLKGWRARGVPEEIERREAMSRLILSGWGQDNPAFRQIFTTFYIPDGTPEQMQWFNELLRVSTSPANALRLVDAFSRIDVTALASQVRVPTLVTCSRHDAAIPYDQSRSLASLIPGARFVLLEGRNHIILQHEPAWPRFASELRAFLAEDADAALALSQIADG
jgi:DNA-binding SARP family transcriptional activator/alpha-beta hydrolase superfamily lysophospholipase